MQLISVIEMKSSKRYILFSSIHPTSTRIDCILVILRYSG